MDMIDEVVSNYKRQKIGGVAAVHKIKCILDIVASSDSEDTVPSGNRIIVPQHQIVPQLNLRPWLAGSSFRRRGLRDLPVPPRQQRPLEKMLGMEVAFCETKLQSVTHVIRREKVKSTNMG